MRPVLLQSGVRSALDIGCNNGWFVVELGRLGIATLGIENHPAYHRTAAYSLHRSGLTNVAVANMSLDDETVALLPTVDCVLFLSLWHHLVNGTGFDAATNVLRGLWDRASKVLLFETVTEQENDLFGVPELLPDSETWLGSYLADVCPEGHVVALGKHLVANPTQDGALQRTMFAVVRSAEQVLRLRTEPEWIGRGHGSFAKNGAQAAREITVSSL